MFCVEWGYRWFTVFISRQVTTLTIFRRQFLL